MDDTALGITVNQSLLESSNLSVMIVERKMIEYGSPLKITLRVFHQARLNSLCNGSRLFKMLIVRDPTHGINTYESSHFRKLCSFSCS
jgi:hypothetical protein